VKVGTFVSEVPKAVPFVDTNMHRVLHRVFFGPEVPQPAAKARELLSLAAGPVPVGEGRAWNQAVVF
jgi:A/G-specific adenine glycosylase